MSYIYGDFAEPLVAFAATIWKKTIIWVDVQVGVCRAYVKSVAHGTRRRVSGSVTMGFVCLPSSPPTPPTPPPKNQYLTEFTADLGKGTETPLKRERLHHRQNFCLHPI